MYYDVVCSIYKDKNCNERVDSHLLCGGFETEGDAEDYINNNDCSKYDNCCSNGEYPCVEVEEHNEDGSLEGLICFN
jgi:hypothetical protein